MSRKLLVISGKKRHGKDTLIKHIIDEYNKIVGYECELVSTAFADPIKKIAKTMFPQITTKDLWGPSENRDNIVKGCINPATGEQLIVRDVLTTIGKWGRDCNKDCWVDSTLSYVNRKVFDSKYPHDEIVFNYIISDGRFLNELEASKKHGAKIVRVIRQDVVSESTDESEINLDNVPLDYYDYVVYNTSLDKLAEEAKKIVDMYILE